MKDNGKTNILVVDDEKYICDIIVETLESENYEVVAITDPRHALAYVHDRPVDLVLTDLLMGEYSGEQVLETTLDNHSDAIVILMTAHPTVETAISVLKKGAYDFLVKPFKLELLKATINRGLRHQRLVRENLSLKDQVEFLKIANASQSGLEIDSFLQMVINACKKEMSAVAVGLIETDLKTREPIRKICVSDDDRHREAVLNETTLQQFAYTKSTKPVVQMESTSSDDQIGVRTFISQPIFVRRRLQGVFNLLILSRFDFVTPGRLDVLTILTNSAGSAIANHRLYQDLQASYLQAIRGLANAIEARDKCTAGHTDRVSRLASLVARHLGWDQPSINHLAMGCSLHDMGKIGVPDSVLNKAGQLTDDERELMNRHPQMGLKIIRGIDLFKPAIPYIIAHHERYDGTGYPDRLKGEEIPIEGRLLAVLDAFDAIMANRPYRKGANLRTAVAELIAYKGVQFDPDIVEAFLETLVTTPIDFDQMYGRDEDTSFINELLVNEKVSV
ncbi:MAG: HD domain-containing phosphohydrolase [bacterium]